MAGALAMLALPRWRLLVGWMVLDALASPATMLNFDSDTSAHLSTGYFLGIVLVRDGVVLALCGLVVHATLRSAIDPADPTGGVDPDGPSTTLVTVSRDTTLGRRIRPVIASCWSPAPARRRQVVEPDSLATQPEMR